MSADIQAGDLCLTISPKLNPQVQCIAIEFIKQGQVVVAGNHEYMAKCDHWLTDTIFAYPKATLALRKYIMAKHLIKLTPPEEVQNDMQEIVVKTILTDTLTDTLTDMEPV